MAGKLILMVGGSSITRAMAAALIGSGHRVIRVTGIAEAIRVLGAIRPSLLFIEARTRDEIEELAQATQERGIKLSTVLIATERNARQWAQEFGAAGFIPRAALSSNGAGPQE